MKTTNVKSAGHVRLSIGEKDVEYGGNGWQAIFSKCGFSYPSFLLSCN